MSRSPKAAARPAVRRPARAAAAPARRRSSSLGSQVNRAFGALPLPRDLLRRIGNWTLGLLLIAGVVVGLIAMGVPQTIGLEIAHGLGRMGFVVRNIEISGRRNVDAGEVYGKVMDLRGQDMALVSLGELRGKLIGTNGEPSWIADARVSRRLPDTLVVDLVERVPAAILQRNFKLSLVDAAGNVLSGVSDRTLPLQLPLVIGDGAEKHIPELQALIASQPNLKQLVAGATWIGGRRWDLRFQSRETLALPEGAAEARSAYATFARKDREERLLGQGFVRFDMRDPSQIVVRTSHEPGAKIETPAPPVPDVLA
jgi:cell division protein FtsQ